MTVAGGRRSRRRAHQLRLLKVSISSDGQVLGSSAIDRSFTSWSASPGRRQGVLRPSRADRCSARRMRQYAARGETPGVSPMRQSHQTPTIRLNGGSAAAHWCLRDHLQVAAVRIRPADDGRGLRWSLSQARWIRIGLGLASD
jgi:hypothetical protein